MVNKKLDFNKPRYCPVYKREIDDDLCYDSLCCLNGDFRISSTKELEEVENIEEARKICANCPYSDLS